MSSLQPSPASGNGGENPYSPLRPVSMKEAVQNEIRQAILAGRLRPGDRLTITQLAADMGVSQQTIREAVNTLADEGTIIKEPYRGLRVAALPLSAVYDIALVRVALDSVAIRQIFEDKTGDKLENLERAWDEYKTSVDHGGASSGQERHLEFHRLIWEASENALLVKLWPIVKAHMSVTHTEAGWREHAQGMRVLERHSDLMKTLSQGDEGASLKAFEAHVMSSALSFMDILTKRKHGGA